MENKKRLLKSNEDHGVVFTTMTESVYPKYFTTELLKTVEEKGRGRLQKQGVLFLMVLKNDCRRTL